MVGWSAPELVSFSRMALGSLLLALLAGMMTVLGFVATVVPGVGAVLSFSAPVLALVGLVLGGTSMSRARQYGQPSDLAKVGVVLNILALFPALMVATTCGVCSALLASGPVQVQRSYHFNMGFPQDPDAGVPPQEGPTGSPGPLDPPPIDAPAAPDDVESETEPSGDDEALPPPPLPPGPGAP